MKCKHRFSLFFLLVVVGACGDDQLLNISEMAYNGEAAVPELIDLLGDNKWKVRREAALALANIGAPASDAVPALIVALNDQHEGVRYHAALALGKIGAAEAVTGLSTTLNDANQYVRVSAAQALGAIGEPVDEVVTALLAALAENEFDAVRGAAAQALGVLGAPPQTDAEGQVNARPEAVQAAVDQQIVPALITAMNEDQQETVRDAATRALITIETPEAIGAVNLYNPDFDHSHNDCISKLVVPAKIAEPAEAAHICI